MANDRSDRRVWDSEIVPLFEQDRDEQTRTGRSTQLHAKSVLQERRRLQP